MQETARPTQPPEWRTGRVDHDGESLYYEVTGAGRRAHRRARRTAPADARVLVPAGPALAAAGYRVVTWDSRGFGNSTCRSGTVGADVAAGDLAAILDAPGSRAGRPRRPVDGRMVGQRVHVAHPQRVRTLTLANTIGGSVHAGAARAFPQPAHGADRPTCAASVGTRRSAPQLTTRDPALAFLYQQLDSFHEPPFPAVMRALTGWEVTHEQIDATGVPVLVVTSPEDQLFPAALIRAGARALARRACRRDRRRGTFVVLRARERLQSRAARVPRARRLSTTPPQVDPSIDPQAVRRTVTLPHITTNGARRWSSRSSPPTARSSASTAPTPTSSKDRSRRSSFEQPRAPTVELE